MLPALLHAALQLHVAQAFFGPIEPISDINSFFLYIGTNPISDRYIGVPLVTTHGLRNIGLGDIRRIHGMVKPYHNM